MHTLRQQILVVDDDGPQRRSLCLGLALLGFDAVEAQSSAAALSMLETTPIALAMVDVCMPHEDGVQLVRRLQFRHPRLPVVLMSGECHTPTGRDQLSNVVAFVPKPCNLAELVGFLQRTLGAPERARSGHELSLKA